MHYCSEFYSDDCPGMRSGELGLCHPPKIEQPVNKINNEMENTNNNKVLEAALRYCMFGYSVIPIGRDKKPLIEWKRYQTERAAPEQITAWFKQFPNAGIGIVTGAISGIVVVDVEDGGRTDDLPKTVISKTGGGGFHYYYRHPGIPVENGVRIGNKDDKRDIRGDGGYVVAPPSLHASGKNYEWVVPPDNTPFAEFPSQLLKQENPLIPFSKSGHDWGRKLNGVAEGERNDVAAEIAGKLLAHIPASEWENLAWPLLCAWNDKNNPPLPEMELRSVFGSIAQRQAQNNSNNTESRGTIPTIVSWKEFGKYEFPWANQWRVKGLIPISARCVIGAPSGEGKSWLAMAMAKSVAAGMPYLGNPAFATTQCKVLYIENETAKYDFQRRGKRLNFQESEENLFTLFEDFPPLKDKKNADALHTFAVQNEIGLIIIDTFRSVAGGIMEEKAEEIRRIFDNFKPFVESGITIVILDHCRKPHPNEGGFIPKKEQLLGSQDKFSAPEAVIMLRTKPVNKSADGSAASIYIYPLKNKGGVEAKPFQVDIVHVDNVDGGGTTTLAYAAEIEAKVLQAAVTEDTIQDYLAGQTERRAMADIIEALRGKAGKTSIEEKLRELREAKKVGFTKEGSKYLYWSLGEDGFDGDNVPPLFEAKQTS
jgi:hypothetical protein